MGLLTKGQWGILCLVLLGLCVVPRTITKKTEGDMYHEARLGPAILRLEAARSPEEHYGGLSDRVSLCEECGMIFIFDKSLPRSFVMRDMNFPLDIIWIKEEKVIGWEEELMPEVEPYIPYRSPEPVDTVIEVKAGFVKRAGLEKGDRLHIQ